MYFMPDISILLSITINTVIHVIDDRERNTLRSLSLKMVFNTSFISRGVARILVYWTDYFLGFLRRLIWRRPDQIPVLGKITKAIIALGALPTEPFPAGWVQLIWGSGVFNCLMDFWGTPLISKQNKVSIAILRLRLFFTPLIPLQAETAFDRKSSKRISWLSARDIFWRKRC